MSWDTSFGLRIAASFSSSVLDPETHVEEIKLFTIPPDVVAAFGAKGLSKTKAKECAWWGYWPDESAAKELDECRQSHCYGSSVDDGESSAWDETITSAASARWAAVEESVWTPHGPLTPASDAQEQRVDDYVLHLSGAHVGHVPGKAVTIGA
ncbi:MAG: hypothetical protein Q9162_005564 [Coniocarpon cinnabarinum]